jgi:ubiquinone/menaquinone biosynthesis C-methylase UbiE
MTTGMRQADHMEAIFAQYVAARFDSVANKAYYDFWCARILGQIPRTTNGGVFLELMCGTGELLARLNAGPEVRKVGIDLTLRLLAYGAARHQRFGQFVCGDARRLPIGDESIHVIVIQGGLHHVVNDLEDVFSEIGRVLVPGGILVCAEPCNDNPCVRLVRHLVYRTFKIFDPTTERGLRRNELITSLAKAGLTMERLEPFGYIGFALIANTDVLPWFRRLRWKPAIQMLLWADDVLSRTPVVRGLGWLCIFRARKQ